MLDQLFEHKVVVREPKFSNEFTNAINLYMDAIQDKNTNGALFLCVCKGKVSEGMDFADEQARAVIVIGIPFPTMFDVKVKLKKEYNDKKRRENPSSNTIFGREWYELEGYRAVNQALGRCLRHRIQQLSFFISLFLTRSLFFFSPSKRLKERDYGAIILYDQVFSFFFSFSHFFKCVDVVVEIALLERKEHRTTFTLD